MKSTEAPSELARLQARNRELEAQQARLEADTAQLRSAHAQLEAETVRLRSAHAQLEADTARLQAAHVEVVKLKEGLETQLQEALLELAELKRQLFGEKSEKLTPEEEAQLAEVAADLEEQVRRDPPASDDVLEEEAEPASEKGSAQDPSRRKRRRGRHPLPEHLERQTVVIEPEGLKPCAHCGGTPGCIGEEVTEELEYVPAKVVVRRIVRRKYACRCGCGGVQVAPLPPRLLPQSKLGLALAVYLLLARFDDHVAYYTLERIFRERHGVDVPRQQMVQWVEQVAFLLQPLVQLMFQRMKQGGYLQVDETPVKVMDPEVKGKCARGYLWFYAVPGGDVYLDFQGTRGRDAPHAQLTDFTGTIQTDAYEVYDALKKVIPNLVRIGCAAHARRAFHRALRDGDRRAIAFIARFRQLYQIEREARELTPEHRHQLRQRQAVPIWEKLQQEAQALQPQLLPKSRLGKAVNYLLNEYSALTGYLHSGTYEIDNNIAYAARGINQIMPPPGLCRVAGWNRAFSA